MRMAAPCGLAPIRHSVKKESKVARLYTKQKQVLIILNAAMSHERHRHRYEVNPQYVDMLAGKRP